MPIPTIALAVCLSLLVDDPPSSGATQPPSAPPSSPASSSGGGGFRPQQGGPAGGSGGSLPPSSPAVSPAIGAASGDRPTASGGGFPPSSTGPAVTPSSIPPVSSGLPFRATDPPASTAPARSDLGAASTGASEIPVQGQGLGATAPPNSTFPGASSGSSGSGAGISIPQGAREATPPVNPTGAPPSSSLSSQGSVPSATPRTFPPDTSRSLTDSSRETPTTGSAASPTVSGSGIPSSGTPGAARLLDSSAGMTDRSSVPGNVIQPSAGAPPTTPSTTGNLDPRGSGIPRSALPIGDAPRSMMGQGALSGDQRAMPTRQGTIDTEPSQPSLAKSIVQQTADVTETRRTRETPMPLIDAIAGAGDVESRKAIIKRYWGAAIANLDLTYAIAERQSLEGLSPPNTRAEQTELSVAKTTATARVKEAELVFKLAQFDLIETIGQGNIAQAPWPTDSPFIGRYRTNYEQYSEIRTLPASIERIHHSLPLVLDVIESRAEAVAALENHLQAIHSEYQVGRIGVSDVITAHSQLRDQRISMLASVRDYNQLICDYALTVAPQGLPAESVVPMLIKKPNTMMARNGTIQRTSFEQPVNSTRQIIPESDWHSLNRR